MAKSVTNSTASCIRDVINKIVNESAVLVYATWFYSTRETRNILSRYFMHTSQESAPKGDTSTPVARNHERRERTRIMLPPTAPA